MLRVHPCAFSLRMFEGTRVFYFRLFPRVVFEPRLEEWGESVILHFGREFTLCIYFYVMRMRMRLIWENGMRKRKGLYGRMDEDEDGSWGGIESLESG